MTPERLVKMWTVAMCLGLLLFSVTRAAPMMNEEDGTTNKDRAHGDFVASAYPEPTGDNGAEFGGDALLNLPDQEKDGAALVRSITQLIERPVTRSELRRHKNKENKPKSVPNIIPADFSDAKDPLKNEKIQQRNLLSQNSPVKSKGTHQIQRSPHYPTHRPQIRKIPSDFEGSGSADIQARGDNDVSPFSGDGQRFTHIPGQGGAVGPALESSDSRTGLSGSVKSEIVNPHTSGLGSNEIPERETHGGDAVETRDKTTQRAGAAGVSLVEGGNDITGSTNFRELPGKEGNRIDAGSLNAHQGKVEFHYPRVPSKEKQKGGSTSYNEIPKRSKGSSRKDTEESYRNQMTLSEKQRFPGKGDSQGPVLPSRGLGTEVKSKGDSAVSSNERSITHSRKNHYVLHGQNSPTRNKGMSQWRKAWPSRRPHAHRRFSTHRRDSSSESSSSGSSSESDGD